MSSSPAALVLRVAQLFPPPGYEMRRFSTPVLLRYSLNSPCFACFELHFLVHSVLSPPAALVLRFARLFPPPRYETRRFSTPVTPQEKKKNRRLTEGRRGQDRADRAWQRAGQGRAGWRRANVTGQSRASVPIGMRSSSSLCSVYTPAPAAFYS
jgi:hypothetical protein